MAARRKARSPSLDERSVHRSNAWTAMRATTSFGSNSPSLVLAAHVESLLSNSPSKQLNEIARAQHEATERARTALEGAAAARTSEGELDPKDVVALIAVHALERCTERSSSDGERALALAAALVDVARRVVCLLYTSPSPRDS